MLCDDSDKSHASGRNRELRPDAATSSPLISLRAKTFSVDCSRLFMGSFNMDPRSCHTNTEMGLLIDPPRSPRPLRPPSPGRFRASPTKCV